MLLYVGRPAERDASWLRWVACLHGVRRWLGRAPAARPLAHYVQRLLARSFIVNRGAQTFAAKDCVDFGVIFKACVNFDDMPVLGGPLSPNMVESLDLSSRMAQNLPVASQLGEEL